MRVQSGEYNDTNSGYIYMLGEDPEALTKIESRSHFGSNGCFQRCFSACQQPINAGVPFPRERTDLGGPEKARAQRSIATPAALPVARRCSTQERLVPRRVAALLCPARRPAQQASCADRPQQRGGPGAVLLSPRSLRDNRHHRRGQARATLLSPRMLSA